jgi:hypothetical protein
MYENELALASGWFGVQRFVFSASEMMFACHQAFANVLSFRSGFLLTPDSFESILTALYCSVQPV